MNERYVRVVVELEDYDPLVVDLLIDDRKRVVTNPMKMPRAGWWGKLEGGDDPWPFVLRPDGKIDFGGDQTLEDRLKSKVKPEEDEERFGQTNLLEANIEKLAPVSLRYAKTTIDGHISDIKDIMVLFGIHIPPIPLSQETDEGLIERYQRAYDSNDYEALRVIEPEMRRRGLDC